MRRSIVLSLAVMGALLMLTPVVVAEATREIWIGRDVDNTRVVYSATNTSGDTWSFKKNGVDYGTYEATDSTKEYIEVQSKGTTAFLRLRFYADKMTINKRGSKFQYITLAKGKWHN